MHCPQVRSYGRVVYDRHRSHHVSNHDSAQESQYTSIEGVEVCRSQWKHWALIVDPLPEVYSRNFVLHASNDPFIARNIARGFTNSKSGDLGARAI